MSVMLTPVDHGTVTTPEGAVSRVISSPMTATEAALLRAYRIFTDHHHLNVVRVCQFCEKDVDLTVRMAFIGAACACRLRTYQGASVIEDLALSTLPPVSAIVAPDGEPLRRFGVFSPGEASLLRDYKTRVLRAFNWKEKAFCDDCFRSNRKEGTSFHVLDDRIGLRCRCREQTRTTGTL